MSINCFNDKSYHFFCNQYINDAVVGIVCRGGQRCVVKIVRKMSDYYDLAKIEVNVLEKLKELDPDGRQLV